MSWRSEMKVKELFLPFAAIALVLILLTAYMAMFYAPIPATGVRSADNILSSVEGSRIKVTGFAILTEQAPLQGDYEFLLLDHSDYLLWKSSNHTNGSILNADDYFFAHPFWTAAPVRVMLPYDPSFTVKAGTNLTVDGTVTSAGALSTDRNGIDQSPAGANPQILSAPLAQKIFYFHMPAAWVSYMAFFITFVSSLFYLWKRDERADTLAFAAAEIGIVFATLALLTGPIWAKEEWGVYWRWDDTKLVTTFILWVAYIGYLVLRPAISEVARKARVSSVYGVVAFLTVPASLLSSRIAPLMQSSHPEVIVSSTGSLSLEAGITVAVSVIGFSFLFFALLLKRVEIEETRIEIEDMKQKMGGES
jgi:heme exporter protein C